MTMMINVVSAFVIILGYAVVATNSSNVTLNVTENCHFWISIECAPEYGAGSSSWGIMYGKVGYTCNDIGNIDWENEFSIVIWSITNTYHIQPWTDDYYTNIDNNGEWSRGIHLGYSYEAWLVEYENINIVYDKTTAEPSDVECASVINSVQKSITLLIVMVILSLLL